MCVQLSIAVFSCPIRDCSAYRGKSMDHSFRAHALRAAVFALLAIPALAATAAPRTFEVRLDKSATQPVSGRLLLFAISAPEARAQAKDGKIDDVDTSPFRPTQVSVAAMEVTHLEPGKSVVIDADALAFPAPFSQLPDGEYAVQAVLDVNHDYNYGGRGAGDIVSDVTMQAFGKPDAPAVLSLTTTLPADGDPWQLSARVPQEMRDGAAAAQVDTTRIDLTSPKLSAFWGRPIAMRAWVLVPPEYAQHPDRRYPVVYSTHGFGGTLDYLVGQVVTADVLMHKGETPPMIYVFLDESSATGTHEFADSVNNGPWGAALTTELIPILEQRFRMDARASGRFLTGHSSGGWATLWLQTTYPKIFGGTWSTSPDSSDFHDFTGVDLYAPNANAYHRADGTAYPLVRMKGEVVATFEQFAKLEHVLGEYGGQMGSFDWVFSPRGADGRPVPMFDRDTGVVDAAVVDYWRAHYDIAYRLQTQWPALKPDLDGKIHVIVGDADTFYLDGAAHKLKAVLDGLGAKSEIRFLPGRSHFDLYVEGEDRQALAKKIAWDMYGVARPGEGRPAAKP
jgi:enterochelin esterase-like enzyme